MSTIYRFSHGRGTRKNPIHAPTNSDSIIDALKRDGFTVRKVRAPPNHLGLAIGIKYHPRRTELLSGFGNMASDQEMFETINEVLDEYQRENGLLVIERSSTRTRSKKRRTKRKSRRKHI